MYFKVNLLQVQQQQYKYSLFKKVLVVHKKYLYQNNLLFYFESAPMKKSNLFGEL